MKDIENIFKAIEVPNPGETTHYVIGDHILFIHVDYDQDAANPLEDCDGMGHIRSLSHRHINSIEADEAAEILVRDPDAVALSYFEHGQSLWFVMGQNPPGVEFQWDGVRYAGIWIPDKSCRESYIGQEGKSRRDWMVEQAASACEIYSAWINGNVYGYIVQLSKARYSADGEDLYDDFYDYRFEQALFEDSCWGFLSWDNLQAEVLDAVRRAVTEIK